MLTLASSVPGVTPPNVTLLLHQVRSGARDAVERLFPLVYNELHAIAQRQRFRWQANETLNTTALVHEAYLKLLPAQDHLHVEDRSHFFRLSAQAMRHILINYARNKQRQKRGGDQQRVAFNEADLISHEDVDTLLTLNTALDKLAQVNARHAQIVECRFFAGMTVAETAAALNLSDRTVRRSWQVARLWLSRAIAGVALPA